MRYFIHMFGAEREVRILKQGTNYTDVAIIGDVDKRRYFSMRHGEVRSEPALSFDTCNDSGAIQHVVETEEDA